MTIHCFQTIWMTNHNIVTKALAVECYHTDFSAKCRHNGISGINFHINTFVLATEAATIAIVGRHVPTGCWHRKITQINFEISRLGNISICVYVIVSPRGVEIRHHCGYFLLIGFQQTYGINSLQLFIHISLPCHQVLTRCGNGYQTHQ